MKKICITSLFIFIIILTVAVGVDTRTDSEKYLRIHIRANSNSQIDQEVKYKVKDAVINYLTPYIAECDSKQAVINLLNDKKTKTTQIINGVLRENGLNYTGKLVVRNEKFPTRVYEGFTLSEGFYDAVIVELGKAEGDNWWCVVYPPLCFTGNESGIKYKWKILEIIENFKKNNSA